MEPVFLTKLVSNSNDWLSVRQATIAENIANANTPGFRSKDLEPFTTVISKTQLAMTATHDGHLGQTMEAARKSDVEKADSWTVTHSGNSVSPVSEPSWSDHGSRAQVRCRKGGQLDGHAFR